MQILALSVVCVSLAVVFEIIKLERILHRHQKALEWFADHVYADHHGPKDPVPPELEDLVKPD